MALNDQLKEERKLREEAAKARERANAADERAIGLASRLSEKIKESVEQINESVQNLGIADRIKDALNISNKYVQEFVKKIIPNAFKASVNAIRKTSVSAQRAWRGIFQRDTTALDLQRKALEQINNELENQFGLISGAPAMMSPKQVNAMKAMEAERDAIKSEIARLESKLNQRRLSGNIIERMVNSGKQGVAKLLPLVKKAAIGSALLIGGAIVGIIGLIGKAFTLAFDRLQEVESSVINVRKEFGFSNKTVNQFSRYIDESRGRMLALGLSSEEVATNLSAIVSTLGTARSVTRDEIELINQLNARLGTSAEAAAGVLDIFQLYGPETRKQSASAIGSLVAMAEIAGVGFNVVAQDLAENAESILTTFSGYDVELANAAIQARLLGLDIGKIASVAEGLLDFESSIANEMKAEVLLGRQINLSRLRRAAFAGDEEEVVRGIADLTREIGNLDKLNFFQKKALADATGLSVAELQRSFKLQTELGRLTEAERKQYAALTEEQKKQVGTNATDIKQGLQRVKAISPLLTTVEKLRAQWKSIQEIIAGPLSKVVGMVTNKFTEVINRIREQVSNGELTQAFIRFGSTITQILDKIFDKEFINSVTEFINKGIEWVKKIVSTAASFFGGINSVAGAGNQDSSDITSPKVNDAVIQSGRIITTHPEDYLIATKRPEELVKDPVVIKQEIPKELIDMVKMNNQLLSDLLSNGIDARVAPKKIAKSVYGSSNVR